MRLNVEKKTVVTSLWLALSFSLATSVSYAANFYTIIGPDGHPMIVQKPETAPKVVVKQKDKQVQEVKPIQEAKKIQEAQAAKPYVPVVEAPSIVKQSQKEIEPKNAPSAVTTAQPARQPALMEHKAKIQSPVQIPDQPLAPASQTIVPQLVVEKPPHQPADITQQTNNVNKVEKATPTDQNAAKINKEVSPKSTQTIEDQHFTVIDGEKYVNNEYLEDREFNLEGKKRFYMTPEIGAVHGRYETIERQKGLSTSLLNRIRGNSESEEKKPVVLSSTYFRLPKDEVVQNLEQACFSGKKIVKAKDLSIKNQEIGLWPVAPIKENFAYEVVKLDPKVQNVLLTSYASSSKVQSYYWPLVVFLDGQGCVLEGVSGFKSEESYDNNLQYAAMEGVLRKPDQAVYLFLTPLSSALDVENKQLTNHGQIKLSVIQ
ncbi:putative pilus assembly protein FilE [Acinetobacter guillouiae]|uniref:putative pilus assembly protein FilE n=1 Tax=Acinetobacter guillouiae TaxID=106649 RepID=UPI001CD233C2|nr:putative pilus assembly protein FilE [Acinetobacter guillouiae]